MVILDDRELDVIYVGKQCWNCIHLISVLTGKCKAFERIPKGVLEDKIKHDKVLKGQKGKFIYEPKTK